MNKKTVRLLLLAPPAAMLIATLGAAAVMPHGVAQAEPTSGTIRAISWSNRSACLGGEMSQSQTALWQEIQAAREANIEQLGVILRQTQAALSDELAQEMPNLEAVAMQTEQAIDQLIQAARQNRDRRLAWYAQLDPAQQAQAEKALQRGLARAERIVTLLAMLASDGLGPTCALTDG
ncbi:MAG: hypothetical protein C1943_11210 [Halochromatium sp.]|nr:hypothetical protein [Halochromatium sp.]